MVVPVSPLFWFPFASRDTRVKSARSQNKEVFLAQNKEVFLAQCTDIAVIRK